jgi:DNA-binding CsgD family transcriptional regulator
MAQFRCPHCKKGVSLKPALFIDLVTEAMSDSGLTAREREVCLLIVQGRTNSEIAQRLGTSEKTVKHQARTIFLRFGVSTRGQLMAALFPTQH